MRRIVELTVFAVALFSLMTAQKAQPQLADSPWPMFQHDPQHSGRSKFIGPSNPFIGWVSPVEGTYFRPRYFPVIGKDGNIYVDSDNYPTDQLWAFEPGKGTVGWIYECTIEGQAIRSAPAVGQDGTIYFTAYGGTNNSYLYAISPTGKLEWKYEMVNSQYPSPPNIDSDGTIYVQTRGDGFGMLYAIHPNGTEKWKKTTSKTYSTRKGPAIGLDNNIYFALEDTICSITSEGNINWKSPLPEGLETRSSTSIAVDSNSTIFVTAQKGSTGRLCAFNSDGSSKWVFDCGWRTKINSNICLGVDGTIYMVVDDYYWTDPAHGLYAVNPDSGSLKWKKSGDYSDYFSIDRDGTIYARLSDTLYAINPDSTISWGLRIGLNTGAPIIHDDGTMFLSSHYPDQLISIYNLVPGLTPDLAIYSSEITFDPVASTPGGDVEINVPVYETTGLHATVCEASFYLNDTENLLDTYRVFVPAGGVGYAKGVFNTTGLQTQTYNIIVEISNSTPEEVNLENNQAQADFVILPSLQERIDGAQTGDTVWAAAGAYYENITLKEGVVVKSVAGPDSTIIDGGGSGTVVSAPYLDPTAVIDGFTIRNGSTGIDIERGGVTVINNKITDNGTGLDMIGSFVYSDPIIMNNLFVGNSGKAIDTNNSWAKVINNTVVYNGSGVDGYGFWSSSPTYKNCIIWGNGDDLTRTARATYSCIEDCDPGEGNICEDPMFVDPENGDYSLQEGSPCIDAGDPAYRDPDGTRSDMGWKYYDQSATIARIAGDLVDAVTGEPVTLAKIYLRGPIDDLLAPDDTGHYVFAVPANTGYIVEVFAPNHGSARQENIAAVVGEATEVNFSLTPCPYEIILFPPTNLQGTFEEGKVHLTWQRPKQELVFDDGFYEAAVGFQDQQGILAAGPFEASSYPAVIEKVKVAFDGERAGDGIEVMIYLDPEGSASAPSASQLVFTQEDLSIKVGGCFQEVDLSAEGITLNSGTFFIGIKQVDTLPMWLLLDQSAADGHAFLDSNLDGEFGDMEGALAIRAIISMPSVGEGMLTSKNLGTIRPSRKDVRAITYQSSGEEENSSSSLVLKRFVNFESKAVGTAKQGILSFLANPPQSIRVYRSETAPVEISDANKIATLAGSATSYDDISLGSASIYYYVVAARYATGENIPSEEITVLAQRGDVNGDGDINILDVLAVVNHILGIQVLEGSALLQADCNGDGEINVLDVLGIVNLILGIGECAPGACKAELTPDVMEFLKSLKPYLSDDDFASLMALVKAEMGVPTEYSLAQNYPNPFNPETLIEYAVPQTARVKLSIYNVLGQEVKVLVDETKEQGYYKVRWNGKDENGHLVVSGVYFYTIRTKDFVQVRKMILIR